MKKSAFALSALLACGTANADTILGFDATAGAWLPSFSGNIGSDGYNLDNLSLTEDNITFIQVALEHPIPLVPNVLLAHSKIDTDGSDQLETSVTFDDETFVAKTEISTDLSLTHTDATLYYEILDNWVNLDLGLTARMYNGEFTAVGESQAETIELTGYLPMAYAMARFDLPFTGWSIIAQGNGTAYRGDTHTDLTAKVRWDFVPAIDFAIEAGYRVMSLDLEELDDLQSDIEIKGPYIGFNLHL
ncbi:TIGR04219 family outer membrane beta-barrel protein [Microbulbifer sp. OS29]|uniref:TIGR04219 family outer membrane beta-barrel protein n=1 Tax=Microbulbifer okhotskensis TaxID=2926617 RepID=A0A9X2EQT1_9GAMM|nr:TIGR04219 family outer membrane beta-barrel protein [Microbulbifer okhotskensis]MCO1334013.1 TIGR04219 family outer membrane beta-barrel protein [Microbulbifer okhotskensis]